MALHSAANVTGHWTKTSTAGGKRKKTRTQLQLRGGAVPQLPAAVRLTRVAPRPLDDDNLQRALKAVRDGVADWLGVDDRDPRVRWFYAQAVDGRPRYQAARIEVVHVGAGWLARYDETVDELMSEVFSEAS